MFRMLSFILTCLLLLNTYKELGSSWRKNETSSKPSSTRVKRRFWSLRDNFMKSEIWTPILHQKGCVQPFCVRILFCFISSIVSPRGMVVINLKLLIQLMFSPFLSKTNLKLLSPWKHCIHIPCIISWQDFPHRSLIFLLFISVEMALK